MTKPNEREKFQSVSGKVSANDERNPLATGKINRIASRRHCLDCWRMLAQSFRNHKTARQSIEEKLESVYRSLNESYDQYQLGLSRNNVSKEEFLYAVLRTFPIGKTSGRLRQLFCMESEKMLMKRHVWNTIRCIGRKGAAFYFLETDDTTLRRNLRWLSRSDGMGCRRSAITAKCILGTVFGESSQDRKVQNSSFS